jgi:hypothetical protein
MSVNTARYPSGIQELQGHVGIDCFERIESRILDDIHRAHAQHHLVFDNENDR